MRMPQDAVVALTVGGIALIAFGILFLRNPTYYRRGIWLKTSIAIRLLSERNYIRYMRGVGVAHIVLGTVALLVSAVREFSN